MSLTPRFTDPSYLNKPWKEYTFIGACMATQMFYQAASTQPLSAMQVIATSFDATTAEKNWFVAAVSFATGTLVLISGRVGDVYGLKRTMMAGYLWTVIWSILTGLAYYVNVTFFIVARALVGAGIAFIIPNMMGVTGTIYSPQTHRKNIVFALIGSSAPIGAFLGVFWSGLIVHYTDRWDACMYAHAGGLAIVGTVTWFVVPNNIPTNVKKVGMDWWGALFGVVALTLFNYTWNEAPAVGWQTTYLYVLLIVSMLSFAAFVVWEWKFARYPLIPHSLAHANKLFLVILLAMLFGWGSFGIWIFYYFRFETEFRGYGSLHLAWTFWPILLCGLSAAICVGLLFRLVRVEFILMVSMVAFLVPDILLAVAPVEENWWRTTFGSAIIIAWGMDLSYPASSIVLSDTLPPDCQGIAGSLTNTITGYSMSVFLGMGSLVEAELLKRNRPALEAFRGALYFAIGCAVLAVCIGFIPIVKLLIDKRKASRETPPLHPEIHMPEVHMPHVHMPHIHSSQKSQKSRSATHYTGEHYAGEDHYVGEEKSEISVSSS